MNSSLPEGWEYQKLEKIVEKFQNGYAFSATGYVNEGIPIVSIANISLDGLFKFDEKKEKKWPIESFVELERYRVNFGDLIIAMTDVTPTMNMIGRAAFVNRKQSMLLNQRVGLLICKSNISKRYLSYVLNSEKWIKYCKGSAGLGAQANIGTQDIINGKIPIPPLPEQEKIAAVLGSVDDVIEKTALQIKKLNDLKKSTMNELLTKGIGHTDFKPSELGQIPKSWEVKTIGDVCKICSGKDYKHLNEGSIPVYGTGGFMLFVDDYLYEGESVGIGRKGTIDKPVFLNGKFWTVDTLFYTSNFKDVVPKFLYYVFLTIEWRRYNEASGVPSLSKTTIEPISCSLPPLPEQKQIASILDSISTQIEKVENKLTSLQSLKKSLMQDLLSGKVRVKVS